MRARQRRVRSAASTSRPQPPARAARTDDRVAYLKNRPQPKKQPCSKSVSPAPQVGSPDEKLSPPVGRPGSAAATPAPVRIIPPSTAVVARERMMTPRMVSPQVRVVGASWPSSSTYRGSACPGSRADPVVQPPLAANDPPVVSGPARCCYRCYTDRVTRRLAATVRSGPSLALGASPRRGIRPTVHIGRR